MIKKKKKKKSGGVKFGSVSIKGVKSYKKNEEDRKAGKGKSKKIYFKAKIGRQMIYILPPTSDKMNGYPFVNRLIHNNIGPEKKFAQCCRLDLDSKTRAQCPQCMVVSKKYDKVRALEKEKKLKAAGSLKKEASSESTKPRALLQILDVTGAYNIKTGKLEEEFPTCFGENVGSDEEKYKKCRNCSFLDSCKKGIQLWEIQYTPYQAMMEKLAEDEVDITNPENALPMKLKRIGEGQMNTKYIPGWDVQNLKIPPHIISFMEKNATDLSTMIKPSTEEEMLAMMGGESLNNSKNEKSNKDKSYKDTKVVKPKISDEERTKIRKRLKEMSEKRRKESES